MKKKHFFIKKGQLLETLYLWQHSADSPIGAERQDNKVEADTRARSMTRSALIARLADRNPYLYQRDVERVIATIFDSISAVLARGDRVELRGFGAFSVKVREARTGRNPRTGESVAVMEKAVPCFKTGKQLCERLNTP